MQKIIKEGGLVGIYPYLEDVTVAGNTIEELRECSMKFKSALNKRKMTLNEDKTGNRSGPTLTSPTWQ